MVVKLSDDFTIFVLEEKMTRASLVNTFDEHMDIPDSINKKYIQEYMNKYGAERTDGFIDALNLLSHHLDYVSTEQIVGVRSSPYYIKATPANTRTKLILFKESLKCVLKSYKENETQNAQPSTKSYNHN